MKLFVFIILFYSPNVLSIDVVYPGHERNDYVISVLKQALSYDTLGKSYQVLPHGLDMSKDRAFKLMSKGKDINIMFGSATRERETLYLPIRFPLMRGLNGWRIALINRNKSTLFESISTLDEFKLLRPGQRDVWSDTQILESNNIKVIKGSNYGGLYTMLHKNRFDYFPRSVLRVEQDLQNNQQLNLMIDPYVLIHYPTAYYFYVRKGDVALAKDIKTGLEKALADGQLNKLFMEDFGNIVNRIKAQKRTVFHLNNPFLPPQTPLSRSELWVDLAK